MYKIRKRLQRRETFFFSSILAWRRAYAGILSLRWHHSVILDQRKIQCTLKYLQIHRGQGREPERKASMSNEPREDRTAPGERTSKRPKIWSDISSDSLPVGKFNHGLESSLRDPSLTWSCIRTSRLISSRIYLSVTELLLNSSHRRWSARVYLRPAAWQFCVFWMNSERSERRDLFRRSPAASSFASNVPGNVRTRAICVCSFPTYIAASVAEIQSIPRKAAGDQDSSDLKPALTALRNGISVTQTERLGETGENRATGTTIRSPLISIISRHHERTQNSEY